VRNEPRGRKSRPFTDVKRTDPGKNKWRYACRLFRKNNLEERAVWHVDPLLGNDPEITKNITAVTENRLREYVPTGKIELQQGRTLFSVRSVPMF
jgi:hypothetical protein